MIKVGILGTGFGKYHAQLYKKIKGFEVVAIFGRDKNKLEKISSELGIYTTMDINEIVKNPEIELVDICLPTPLHAEWAIEALRNNKHVFCETPVSYDIEEAEKIKRVSEEYKKNVFVDLFYKFSTPHNIAINKIKNNELGDVISFSSYNKTAPNWGDLCISKNISDFHIHNFDFLTEILGLPYEVFSNGIDLGKESIIVTTLNYKNKMAIVQSYTNLPLNSPFYIGFEIICEKGTIRFAGEYGDTSKEEFVIYYNDGSNELLNLEVKDDYEEVIKHILYCMENNERSKFLNITSAIESMKIKSAILRALVSKKFECIVGECK